jgi:N-acetylmuramoyl-L-alanine amidase
LNLPASQWAQKLTPQKSPGFTSTAGENVKNEPEPGNRFDAGSLLLAYEVHRAVLAQTGAPDRGVKHARFDVLAQAPCPALLIECGFLSNAYEESMVSMKHYRDVLAEGIANGVMAYLSNTLAYPLGHARPLQALKAAAQDSHIEAAQAEEKSGR